MGYQSDSVWSVHLYGRNEFDKYCPRNGAGKVWSLLVNVTAVGMLLFAMTGLFVVFGNRRKRLRSLWVVGLRLATPVLLFIAFVPSIRAVG